MSFVTGIFLHILKLISAYSEQFVNSDKYIFMEAYRNLLDWSHHPTSAHQALEKCPQKHPHFHASAPTTALQLENPLSRNLKKL
jgi:hypothetical protein